MDEQQEIRVLSIENNPGDALLIREKLAEATKLGWDLPHFEVEHVKRLQAALDRLDAALSEGVYTIDVVLSDLDLFDSQAGETFATLRQRFPHMPIVVLTGREDEELARTSVRAGAQDYLFKNEATGSLLAHALIYAIERQDNARALQKAHDELEQRVEERTQELHRANQELKAEITEHRLTEEALRESEQRYRTLLENAPLGIGMATPEGEIITGNGAICEMFGLSLTELKRVNVRDFYRNPEQRDLLIDRLQKDGYIRDFEAELMRADGSTFQASITINRLIFDGQPMLLTVLKDITERKEIEEALQERVKELTCLYAVNRDVREDFSIEELCHRVIEHLKPAMQFPEITVPVIELDGKRFSPKNYTEELNHGLQAEIRVDGQSRGHLRTYYVEERSFLMPEEQNLINGIAEALSVWLERKEAERQNRFHAHLLDAVEQAVIVTNLEGRVVYWNSFAERLYGWPAEEAIGRTTIELIANEQAKQYAVEIMSHLQSGESWSGEYVTRHRDGSPLPVYCTITPIHDSIGEVTHIIGISSDLTERKQAKEALRQITDTA